MAIQMPKYAGIAGLAFMCALGLPGLALFISEAMVFMGSFRVFPAFTILAATSVVITAAYMLWTVQRVFLGKIINEHHKEFEDLTPREAFTLYPLAVCVVVFGFYPMPILNLISSSVNNLAGLFGQRVGG